MPIAVGIGSTNDDEKKETSYREYVYVKTLEENSQRWKMPLMPFLYNEQKEYVWTLNAAIEAALKNAQRHQ
jgi:hypothetical protein